MHLHLYLHLHLRLHLHCHLHLIYRPRHLPAALVDDRLTADEREELARAIADALDAVFDAIPTYPMWLIGTVGLDLYIPKGTSARRRRCNGSWRSAPGRLL